MQNTRFWKGIRQAPHRTGFEFPVDRPEIILVHRPRQMPRRLQFAFHERLVDDELSRFVCEWRLPDQFDLPGKRLEIRIRSTPKEMASTRLKCFECLARTGVHAWDDVSDLYVQRPDTRAAVKQRTLRRFPGGVRSGVRLIDSNVATATGLTAPSPTVFQVFE